MFARIAMSMCPGREWGHWSRDLETDLKIIVENKVDIVASIITHTELKQMALLSTFYEKIKNLGIESIEYSIHDKWLPNSVDNFIKVVYRIVDYLKQDKTVLVHCNGGRGRTGLIVAACIMIIGYTSEQAIQMVRQARSGMLRNPAQEVFLHAFQSKLQSETQTPPSSPQIARKTSRFFDLLPSRKPKSGSGTDSDNSPILSRGKDSSKFLSTKKSAPFIQRSEQTIPRNKTKSSSVTLINELSVHSSPNMRKDTSETSRNYSESPRTPPPRKISTPKMGKLRMSMVNSFINDPLPPSPCQRPLEVPNVFSYLERGEIPLELYTRQMD